MTPQNQEAAANELALRDIHLPETSLWWPPAPGWWILLVLIIILIVTVYYFLQRVKKKKLSAIYLAKQELDNINKDFAVKKDKSKLIKELSELIRRVTISVYNRNESASLTGEDWLLFLDNLNGDDAFSNGIGRVLIEAPYQAKPDYDENALLILISNWIESVNSQSNIKGNTK